MKVAINISLLYDAHLRGWNRYTVSLIQALLAEGLELYLYSRKEVHSDFSKLIGEKGVFYRQSPSSNYFYWEQVLLPKWCELDQVDILHSPFNYGLPFKSPCKKVLTLHDAIEQKHYFPHETLCQKLAWSSLKYRFLQSSAPKNADHIITVSHHACADIQEIFKIAKEKISVTYEAHPKEFEEVLSAEQIKKIHKKYEITCPYFFYIGGFDERKNLNFLLEAYQSASLQNIKLLLAGGSNADQLKDKANELGISSSLLFPGYINDADLPAFYQGASAFIYPSMYEGFGLQICESLASACPTLVSNQSSLPEVLGNGGECFELSDRESLSSLLKQLEQDKHFKEALSSRALIRSKEFSWKKTALQTIEIYKKVLKLP